MSYSVHVGDSAFQSIREYARFIAVERKAPLNAQRWLERLWDAIDALETWPNRHPVDPVQTESRGVVTHKMVFGDYLVFYVVDDHALRVDVVGFLHGSRRRRV